MRALNRAAFLVRYREPYLRWAASIDERVAALAGDLDRHVSVYLVPEAPDEDEGIPPLRDYFEAIFTQEIKDWCMETSQWPRSRDYATFLSWFEVTTESIVTDLGSGLIEIDEL